MRIYRFIFMLIKNSVADESDHQKNDNEERYIKMEKALLVFLHLINIA